MKTSCMVILVTLIVASSIIAQGDPVERAVNQQEIETPSSFDKFKSANTLRKQGMPQEATEAYVRIGEETRYGPTIRARAYCQAADLALRSEQYADSVVYATRAVSILDDAGDIQVAQVVGALETLGRCIGNVDRNSDELVAVSQRIVELESAYFDSFPAVNRPRPGIYLMKHRSAASCFENKGMTAEALNSWRAIQRILDTDDEIPETTRRRLTEQIGSRLDEK